MSTPKGGLPATHHCPRCGDRFWWDHPGVLRGPCKGHYEGVAHVMVPHDPIDPIPGEGPGPADGRA
jgi:hypothetical protein